ncbi:MAG: hypothetical protein C0506_13425 [Anaerolinea sp.]|nr:hypothetical protein [Anaerolinea sp.]
MLFAFGSLLALGSLLFALSPGESTAAPVYKVTLPGLSGDDSSGATYATPGANPTASPTTSATPIPGSCNYDRAAVKTLSDPAAGFGRTPKTTGVTLLTLLPRPALVPQARIPGDETAVYSVVGSLTSVSMNASRELVVLITDPANTKSMLLYFPHKDCIKGAAVDDQVTMNKVRAEFEDACGDVSEYGSKQLRGQATFSGVAHWGSTTTPGAAPNGMELHPVLSFAYGSSVSCDPDDPQPAPTPTPPSVPTVKSVSISGVPNNIQAGDEVTATVQVSPALLGVTCEIVYYPAVIFLPRPSQNVGLSPAETDAFGRVSFTWTIPTPASYAGQGAIDAKCGTASVRIFFFISPAGP